VNLAATGWHTVGPKYGPKTRVGQKVMLKIEKLKGSSMTAPQIKEVLLLNTTGFDTQGNLLDAGVNSGWVYHKHKSKEYSLGDTVFPKADWPAMVQDMGGVDAAYNIFLNWCQENGTMDSWA